VTVVQLPTRHRIGGSEAAAVLGCDPFLSPTMLAARKLGLVAEQEESEAMKAGRRMERWNREWMEDDGYTLIPPPEDGFTHPEIEWWQGKPDAFTSVFDLLTVVECKAHGVKPDERLWLRDELQALHYLACTGLDYALVSVIHGGYGGFRREERVVERDEGLFYVMRERYEAFRALLERGELPEGDGSDSAREFYRRRSLVQAKTIRLDKEGWANARQARFHAERERYHKQQAEIHWQAVQAQMGEATHAINAFDEPVCEWSESDYTRLDTKALKEARPDVYEEFSTTTTRRRFLIK